MSSRKIKCDVLCVGNASYDLVFSVPHHPRPDEKSIASSFLECGGGPAANAAVTVARLGYRAAFAGYLGQDYYGDQHMRELEREGVVTDLVVRGTSPTRLSVALVKPDGKRALFNYRGSTGHLPPHSVDFSILDPSVILFDGHEPLISPPLARSARENGCITTILDAGSVHRGTEALIPVVDYLVCSEKFARQFTGETDETRAVAELSKHVPAVVITLGERGLIWRSAQGMGRVPAFSVTAADTTGAGDAFHGAFAVCVASNQPWDHTLRYSSAVAALCCTRIGARPGIPTQREVEEFLDRAAEAS
jgi:sulfofructose kinase